MAAHKRKKKSRYDSSSDSDTTCDSAGSDIAEQVSQDANMTMDIEEDSSAEDNSDFNPEEFLATSNYQVTRETHIDVPKSSILLGQDGRTEAPESLENFLALCTEEFGEDLNQLRENGFGPGSLNLLIDALKAGVNILSKKQRDLILKA